MQRELFEAHARLEEHHWWFTARRAILQALMHAVAPPGRQTPVVDVGCGTGGNVAAFAGEYDVLGLDPSADAIALARARFPQVAFEVSDSLAPAARHLSGGGVLLMTDVLEHVPDHESLFQQAVEATPTGGTLLLTVPNDPSLWSSHDEIFGHSRRYTVASFRSLWRDAPVEERLLSPFNARLQPVIALIRRLRRMARPRPGGDLGVPAGPANAVLRRIFAGEAAALVAALDQQVAPFRRGVSLMAVLRRR